MGLREDMMQAHLDEPCPMCRAKSGDACITAAGKKTSKPHADRIHNGNILFEEQLAAKKAEGESHG